jgi:hypothetical protein
MMRVHAITAALAVALAAPTLALADVAPAGSTDQLQVQVKGHISPQCGVSLSEDPHVDLGDIQDHTSGAAAKVTTSVPFHMACNTAFRASMHSRKGGLAFEGSPAQGFSSLVDYSATLSIAGGTGISLTCDAADIKDSNAGPHSHSNDGCKQDSNTKGYSAADGSVKVTTAAGGKPLLMGTYSDEIVLCLSPLLGGEAQP